MQKVEQWLYNKFETLHKNYHLHLKRLQVATPALATVSGNLQELEENTKLAADIAAVTGLSFQDASSQIQRAFSAGAGAADQFREKRCFINGWL